jgi:hypothetical protein
MLYDRLIAAGVTYLFPGSRAVKLVKDSINVTNLANPLILTKNITLVVVDCCTPPPVRLVAHCVAAVSLIAASVVSPNPVTIGSAVHVVTELYENC